MTGPELCVSAVVVDDDQLLVVRRGRGLAQGSWAAPGGRVQAGETLAEAVVRELLEETAIEGVCGALLGCQELLGGTELHQVVLAYRVSLLEAAQPRPGDDATEARWVPLGEVSGLRLAPGFAEFLHDHQVITVIT
ncbi:MAG: NUDIX domain-containing protein [Acidimicrobiales bacterium]